MRYKSFKQIISQFQSIITKLYLLIKYYKIKNVTLIQNKKIIIYMADGRIIHGGLSDRLWGMISLYDYCLENNIMFKIYFEHPFKLEKYLLPNEYNWKLNNNLIYDYRFSMPIIIKNNYNKLLKEKILKQCNESNKTQFHIYTNMRYRREYFSQFFHILFKPSFFLNEKVSEHLKKINGEYISITFRFQQLLGDFVERKFPVLPRKKQEKFIDKCLSVIHTIKEKHSEYSKILITSDSEKFLNRAKELSNVYIVPGKRLHPDYDIENLEDEYLKSFIDMFLIANAKKIYFIKSAITYKSQFAKTAANIYNIQYEEIII